MFTTNIKEEKNNNNREKFCAPLLCCFYVAAEVKEIHETDEKCDNP